MSKELWKYKPLEWMAEALSRLPLRVLYILSDLLYTVLYRLVKYRLQTVRDNLNGAFPEKSPKELRNIEKQFYRNFADYIVETIKLLHISDREMKRRMTFSGIEAIDRTLANGRPVVCYFSHTGNWEWAPSITLWSSVTPGKDALFCQIYRPLRNEWFDRLMLRIRGRFGSISLPKRRAFLDLLRYRKECMPTVTGFMSDQKPSHGDIIHVVEFLNRQTAVITGTETVCRRLDAKPFYWEMSKPSRGHYHIDIIEMEADISQEFALTDLYASMLEKNICQDPSLWLWTHKRWKHPVTPEMNGQKI